MSAVSSINNNLYKSYQALSSGKKINSAADNAAGLAIAEKLENQSRGYDAGTRNAGMSQDMLKVAEGALSGITDSLQRIRELSVQASNAIYSDADKGAIQMEIDQLKQSIAGTASQTQFNTLNILDGSMGNMNVATDSNGGGLQISMPKSTLEVLGIEDYDVTGAFDISDIDKALEKVTSARAGLGASSNRLDYVMNYNSLASHNTIASRSRLEDLDIPKAVSDLKKNQLLETMSIMMQKKKEEEERKRVSFWF